VGAVAPAHLKEIGHVTAYTVLELYVNCKIKENTFGKQKMELNLL
jgi:hypothetical protein